MCGSRNKSADAVSFGSTSQLAAVKVLVVGGVSKLYAVGSAQVLTIKEADKSGSI